MSAIKWAGAIPAFLIWLVTLPFAWAHDASGKFLGFDEV